MSIDFKKLDEDWPSPFVARSEMEKFTKGLYKGISLNAYGSRKCGIKRKILRGTKVIYLKADVIEWLKTKVKKLIKKMFLKN